MSHNPEVDIVWYGERGIVNAIVFAIHEGGIEATQELLKAIAWAGNQQTDWIDDIVDASMIVEVGLSQFGDPDVILVCTTANHGVRVVFIEAKVIPYLTSAMDIGPGMRTKFNSSINGQITLKYRCAQALSNWNGSSPLLEPQSIFAAYLRSRGNGGLNEPREKPRRLVKGTVCEILARHNMAGIASNQFYFVALTTDSESPFSVADFASWPYRPLFLDATGAEIWEQVLPRIGWLGYDTLAGLTTLNRHLGENYANAIIAMELTLATEEQNVPVEDLFPGLQTYDIAQKSTAEVRETMAVIRYIARKRFGERSTVVNKGGSISLKPYGKTLLKVFPYFRGTEEKILLGVSHSLRRRNWGIHLGDGFTLRGQQFYSTDLDPDEQAEVACETAFEVLAEYLELDSSADCE